MNVKDNRMRNRWLISPSEINGRFHKKFADRSQIVAEVQK